MVLEPVLKLFKWYCNLSYSVFEPLNGREDSLVQIPNGHSRYNLSRSIIDVIVYLSISPLCSVYYLDLSILDIITVTRAGMTL